MSYVDMDHAAWLERNIQAAKNLRPKAPTRDRYGARKGLEGGPDQLNAFQRAVANIIGIAGGGIYNAPIDMASIRWLGDTGLLVNWRGDLATFDFDRLSRFVFLAHDARIRFSVEPAMRDIQLGFWARTHEGTVGRRHPSLEEAVAAYRAAVPLDHVIAYRPAPAPALADA